MSDIADSADACINLDLEYALKIMQRCTNVEPDRHCFFLMNRSSIENCFVVTNVGVTMKQSKNFYVSPGET